MKIILRERERERERVEIFNISKISSNIQNLILLFIYNTFKSDSSALSDKKRNFRNERRKNA